MNCSGQSAPKLTSWAAIIYCLTGKQIGFDVETKIA